MDDNIINVAFDDTLQKKLINKVISNEIAEKYGDVIEEYYYCDENSSWIATRCMLKNNYDKCITFVNFIAINNDWIEIEEFRNSNKYTLYPYINNKKVNIYKNKNQIDTFLLYQVYIEHMYPDEQLEQIDNIFWEYSTEKHYWNMQHRNNIESNFWYWVRATGILYLISLVSEPTNIINKASKFLKNHSTKIINENPFKESDVKPYLHTANGAINITKKGIKFYDRNDYGEQFFQKLYPKSCLEYTFDMSLYRNINPKKHCPVFYHYIRTMIPYYAEDQVEETIDLFSQILAYCFSPIKPNEYFFGLYGRQETGKSFFMKIIKNLIGHEFCIERRISEMEGRFATSDLWGKKVYIEPDLKTRELLPEDFIKSYAGQQNITVERKHENSTSGVKTSIAMFFISNYIFKVKGVEGLTRRIILIPYKKKLNFVDRTLEDKMLGILPHGKESGEFNGKIFDERPAILAMAVKGWKLFCKNNYEIKMPEWIREEKANWVSEASTVNLFMKEQIFDPDLEIRKKVKKSVLHSEYVEWCKDAGKKHLGKHNFYEELMQDERVVEYKTGGERFFKFEKDPNLF